MPPKHRCKYVVITPAKDEAPHIEVTIRSMVNQTVLPLCWVIVDDGSTDETRSIVERCSQGRTWIRLLSLPQKSTRQPGSAVIRAFDIGLQSIRQTPRDFVVKMDADLDLPADYFERLLAEFEEDDLLGIASGIYLERVNREWTAVEMPEYHAAGASKVVRAKCFEDIGGFVPYKGWDTVDEIRARMKGWKTCHFPHLRFHHLKFEGAGIGRLRTNFMHGEIYHSVGGGMVFFVMKCLHRMVSGKPFLLGGVALLAGYMTARFRRKLRLVSDAESQVYRRMLNHRMLGKFRNIPGSSSAPELRA